MKRFILYFLLFGISSILTGQYRRVRVQLHLEPTTIPAIIDLNSHYDYLMIRNKKASKIECKEFNNDSQMSFQITFDSSNYIINQKHFWDGRQLSNKGLFFNEQKQLEKVLKYHIISNKIVADTVKYIYDNNILSAILYRSYNTKADNSYIIKSDDHGNPIRMVTLNKDDKPTGAEGATYDYFNNEFTYYMEHTNDPPRIEQLESVNNLGTQFNEYGDVTFIPLNNNNCVVYQYKYDEYGNWIVRKKFTAVVKPDHKISKKKIKSIYERIITYRD